MQMQGSDADTHLWRQTKRGGRGPYLFVAKYMLRGLPQSLQTRLCSLNAYVTTFAKPTMSIDSTACATSFILLSTLRDAPLEMP